ncbi:hypothetical protein FB45DRAFT_875043 [Roridomyces roridus]|uniref:Uncharacterized protein n=1 Tax=Roridomyces roridus TaxID=1738132 RepID=A0AAD7FAD8_9AGAR|nr:hypothetical protein FB45DRAFT_875043 [Roridomyces roridus]
MHYGHILAGRPGHARIAIRVPAKCAHNAFWVLPLVRMRKRNGRPPLAPAVKEANLKNAKAKYEEDNRELRARKSRERMQRKRAAIAKDPIAHSKAKQKAAHHSETYRDRKWVEAQAAARQAEAIQKAAANRMRKEEMERHLPARRQREVVSKSASGSTTPGLSLSAIHAADSDDEEFHVQNAGLLHPIARLLGPMRCAGCHSEELSWLRLRLSSERRVGGARRACLAGEKKGSAGGEEDEGSAVHRLLEIEIFSLPERIATR